MEEETVCPAHCLPVASLATSVNAPLASTRAGVNFLDGVSDAIANIARSVQIAGVRGFRHEHAHDIVRSRACRKVSA